MVSQVNWKNRSSDVLQIQWILTTGKLIEKERFQL